MYISNKIAVSNKIGNKIAWFSYKGGCGICGNYTHIKVFKRGDGLAIDKLLQVISNIKTVISLWNCGIKPL